MMNMSIECDVKSCQHNHCMEKFCMLEHIKIGQKSKPEGNYSDCMNFIKR